VSWFNVRLVIALCATVRQLGQWALDNGGQARTILAFSFLFQLFGTHTHTQR